MRGWRSVSSLSGRTAASGGLSDTWFPRMRGKSLASSELRAFVKERLPDYMVPAAFIVLLGDAR